MFNRPEMTLSRIAVGAICDAVRKPNEAEVCGFLFGCGAREQLRVEFARQAQNIYGSRSAFAICQQDYKAALAEVDSRCGIVGIFHLHPGVALPSCADRRSMALHAFYWLIVGIPPHSRVLKWKCFKPTRKGIVRVFLQFEDCSRNLGISLPR